MTSHHYPDAPKNTYQLFGQTLTSDFAFANTLAQGAGDADLAFAVVEKPPFSFNWEQAKPVYVSVAKVDNGEPAFVVYQFNSLNVLHFSGIVDFYLDSEHILCHLLDPAYTYMIEICFLGTVLAFWLERSEIPTLHASATVIGEQAVAFLSNNQGGKSGLAATYLQAGYPLLTDDLLPIVTEPGIFLGVPGYPTMRMWPDEALYFLGQYRDLALVHPKLDKRRVPIGTGLFGDFCDVLQPLACIYLPDRYQPTTVAPAIEIMPLSPRDAMIELVRHSFIAHTVTAMGWQARRLDFFAQLVQHVPVRRLRYPSGFEHLPRVREHILADLRANT